MRIEWLILADAAEVVGNKLYLLGGGWDRLTVHAGFPVVQHAAVAVSVVVPWENTNQVHEFCLHFASPQGKVLATIEAEFEVGRPPGVPPGRSQRWQFAGMLDLSLEGPGRHVLLAQVDGEEGARQEFDVVLGKRAADLPTPS